MPPITPSTPLTKPPLAIVLAQIQTMPVVGIERHFPDLQEIFRKNGYPAFEERAVNQAVWTGQSLSVRPNKTGYFTNKANTRTIIVSENAVSLMVTDYSRFEIFRDSLAQILNFIAEIVAPSVAIRYGLRYINLIPGDIERSFSELITTDLLGSRNLPGTLRNSSFSETLFDTEKGGHLVLRCTTLSHGHVIPLDMMPFSLLLPPHMQIEDYQILKPFAILDQDHFLPAQDDFDVSHAVSQFSVLHDLQHTVFTASVTDAALAEWT